MCFQDEFPDGPTPKQATVIIVALVVALSTALITFFCVGCSERSILLFEKEMEILSTE